MIYIYNISVVLIFPMFLYVFKTFRTFPLARFHRSEAHGVEHVPQRMPKSCGRIAFSMVFLPPKSKKNLWENHGKMGVPWFFHGFFYPIGIPRVKYTSCFSRFFFLVFHRNPAIGMPTGDDISTVSWAGFRPFLFSTPDIFL